MAVLQYIGRSLRRRPISRFILGALGMVLVLLICVLEGALQEKKEQLKQVEEMPIRVVVSNRKGEKQTGMEWSERELKELIDPNSLGALLKEEELRWEEKLLWLEGLGEKPDSASRIRYTLYGISRLEAAPELTEDPEIVITYEKSHGDTMFQSRKLICLIGENRLTNMGKSIGDTMEIIFKGEHSSYETEMVIGGVIGGSGADIKEIYCGWEALQYLRQAAENGDELSSDYLQKAELEHYNSEQYRAVVKNNCELTVLKDLAETKGFAEVDPLAALYDPVLALTIHDNAYQVMQKELNKNLRFLNGLRPILWAAACGISFLAGFLTARSRRREIAAIRSLGAGKARVFRILVLEQLILAVLGAGIGFAGYLIFGGRSLPDIWELALILVLYLIGTVVPASRLMGDRELAILMKKD